MKKQKSSYWEKLKDPRWQKKRLETLNHFDFKCSSCGSPDKTLNVHHVFYKKNADPWEYEVGDELVSLCEDCHKYEHEAEDRFLTSLNRFRVNACMMGYNIDYLTGVIDGMLLGNGPDEIELKIVSAEHAAGVAMSNWLPHKGGEELVIELAMRNGGFLNYYELLWVVSPEERKDAIRGVIKRGVCSVKTYKDLGDYQFWPKEFIDEIENLTSETYSEKTDKS